MQDTPTPADVEQRVAELLDSLPAEATPADGALPDALDPERGDVPGWVLVTLMTAGLVVALWALAGDLLQQAFTDAINSVISGP